MEIIEKDILTVERGVIAHQVNCRGAMGAGLAKAIADKWPQVKEQYLGYCRLHSPIHLLGGMQLVRVSRHLIVANLFGQLDYGVGARHTDYTALREAVNGVPKDYGQIYFPFNLGCGLAGGNWKIVLNIIRHEVPDAVICKLPA